ncbi:MAG: hypothetical protein IJ687_04360 [Bacteroidales bacterium]|nr:hypothetical protein [Bacteroidales bacterium]
MKKLFRTVLAVAVAAAAMTSCQKAVMEEEGGINAVVSFQASFPETKTTFGTAEAGKYPVLWQDGDKVAVSVSLTNPLKDLEVTPSTDKKTGTFSKDVTLPGEGPWAFYVMSPSAAMVNASASHKDLTVDFATDQTPTAVSVDPAAQVLLAMATATTIPTEPVPVTFNHLAAYGKVSLTNLPTTAKVTGLSLAFDQPVTGRWYFYPEEEDVTKRFQGNAPSNLVNLTTEKTADVFFAVAPNGVAVKSVKVTLKTEDGNYEKEVTVPEKTFKSGVVSAFTVDMTGASKVQDKVFKLVKNAANLAAGDQVIIANKDATRAISTTQQKNNRKGAAITPDASGDIVNPSAAVQILTVAAGASTGTFAFSPEAGMYLYAVKGNNYLRTKDALEADGSFTVAIAEDGEATVTCKFEGEDRILMHNSSNDLFACYTSGQKPVAIYKMEAAPVKEDVIKWVPSAAGSEVFANGDGDVTVEPTTADWLTWDKATKTVAWTEAAMPRQAKLTFTNGSTYDLTQIDAKVMAGKWTLSGDIRTGTTKGSVAKATATSTSGAKYGQKGGIQKGSWYDDGWKAPSAVSGGVNLPVTVTYNAEGEDPGKYLDPTATGTSADRAKAQKNNLVLTGLYENLTMPARAEVNYEEKWARLYLVIENKNQQLTSGVYSGEYASFQTELRKPDGSWELGFANGGLNYYLGELTVTGGATKVAYPASQTCVYYPSYNMVGIIVNRFATEASTAGAELIRSTASIWSYSHYSYSGSAYARVFQQALTFEMKESVGPEPEPEPKTVEEVLTKAGKNPANYEKLPFWYTKNAWYQSTASSKLQTTTSGGNFNKFVATNIVSKGEIPNGSVVVTMGGDFGYRPEGWMSGAKTTTRPDRTNVQVTEVDDAWWVVGGQNFIQRAFNLDMSKASLTDAEMEEVIEKFAVFVPKTTKALPDPDAVFTTAGYKLDDYTKLELTYNKYAFYHSTHETMGGVLQTKENVPTATNLGQFVATGIIDKANIPNGSVLVVCDGYQYRPEGWQVKGEKNTADRPGNVTTATVVVDDAWWGNFNYRAFNLAYAGNPGIPVTEMDHVIASFAIYVPKADPDPTHIDTAEKLVAFLKAATAETTTDYIMTKDVDMKGVTVPTAAGFKGTFDGKGKTIKNLAATAPLFATLDGTVKDVTLEGTFTYTTSAENKIFGALAAVSTGTVSNVVNKASVTATSDADQAADAYLLGGLIGKSSGTVTKCTNEGAVSLTGKALTGTMVAGVVAYASADVDECTNKGKVSLNYTYTWKKAAYDYITLAKEQLVPGVAGVVGITYESKVTNAKNYGEIVYNETAIENLDGNKNRHQIGGIVAAPNGDVENCVNEGAVSVTSVSSTRDAFSGFENIVCVGGISGGGFHSKDQTNSSFKSCDNKGNITLDFDVAKSNSVVGGIVGWLGVEGTTLVATVEKCSNTGNLTISGTGKGRFGGISGGTANVIGCTNNANVTVNSADATSVAALGVGFHTQGLTVHDCVLEGAVVANCKIDGAGGLYGGQGNVAENDKTYGNKVNATITTDAETTNVGLVVGKISSGKNVVVLGTDAAPIQVKGTVKGTAVTAENLENFLFNGGTAVANKSVKAVLWTE